MAQLGSLGWKILGAACLLVGAIGIILPLLPTTPFVLLAVFAFTRGSPETAAWLRAHGTFGPIISKWEQSGAIVPAIKLIACTMMAGSLIGSWYLQLPFFALAMQSVVLSACAVYILSRPNQ